MSQTEDWLVDPLWDQPEGTIEDCGNGHYLVKGRTRGYGVNWNEKTCGCPHHQYRCVEGELCRHLVLLGEYLNQKDVERKSAAEEISDEELRALFA